MLEKAHLGRYRLVERIAAGGMAEIYLAQQDGDAGLCRTVVIKSILPQFTENPAMRTMLQDEARIGFSLQHRNIVQVIDVGSSGKHLYIAMEYVEGVNLAELSMSVAHGQMPYELVAYIGSEVLAALDYAHNREKDGEALGIVHRDVSPQNVLVSMSGEVKLSDFGIALARDRITKTTVGGVKGKFSYIAPEQAAAETINAKADIFSLGAVLYEMFTGDCPHGGNSDMEILQSIQKGKIVPLSEARPDLPAPLCQVVQSALSFAPEERPTAIVFRRALEPFAMAASGAEEALQRYVGEAVSVRSAWAGQQKLFDGALLGGSTDGNATQSATVVSSPHLATRGTFPRWAVAGLIAGLAVGITLLVVRMGNENPVNSTASEIPARTASNGSSATGAGDTGDRITSLSDARATPPPDSSPLQVLVHGETEENNSAKNRTGRGSITITSFPWAQVTIDGRKVGNTPIRNRTLRAGMHKIVLTNPQSGKVMRKTVRIKPGKTEKLRVEL